MIFADARFSFLARFDFPDFIFSFVARRQAAKAGSHERSLIADTDLKELQKEPALSKPFHHLAVPEGALEHRKSHMNEKAMQDLKALESEQHAERTHQVKTRGF